MKSKIKLALLATLSMFALGSQAKEELTLAPATINQLTGLTANDFLGYQQCGFIEAKADILSKEAVEKSGTNPWAEIANKEGQLFPSSAMFDNATALRVVYTTNLPNAALQMKELFPEEYGLVSLRAKGFPSIVDKLSRKWADGRLKDTSILASSKSIGDGIATRILLQDATQSGVEKFVKRLVQNIASGELVALELENYSGPGGYPYLNDEQIDRIKAAVQSQGYEIKIAEQVKERPNGYTAIHMHVLYPGNLVGEVQIKSEGVSSVSSGFGHMFYDLMMEKQAVPDWFNAEVGDLVRGWSEGSAEYAALEEYFNAHYIYQRRLEIGMKAQRPSLPLALQKHSKLDFDHLASVYAEHNCPAHVNP